MVVDRDAINDPPQPVVSPEMEEEVAQAMAEGEGQVQRMPLMSPQHPRATLRVRKQGSRMFLFQTRTHTQHDWSKKNSNKPAMPDP